MFNIASSLLDIPTGKYGKENNELMLNGGKLSDMTFSGHVSPQRKSMFAHHMYYDKLMQTKAGTQERFDIVARYLAATGFQVEHNGIGEPKVYWVDFEGGNDFGESLRYMLHGPKEREHVELAVKGSPFNDLFEKLKDVCIGKPAIYFDSFSKDLGVVKQDVLKTKR